MAEADILSGLNPADYFTLAMDQEIRNDGMPGSLCGFALILSEPPKLNLLKSRIDSFTERFPLVQASLRQKGRRYYWFQRSASKQNFFHHQNHQDQADEHFERKTIEQIFNRVETLPDCLPLEFHLISSNNRQCFLLRWLHPFCDARGADLILKFLCADDDNSFPAAFFSDNVSLVNSHLQKFSLWQKINLLFKGRALIKQLDRQTSILPYQGHFTPQKLAYRTYQFSTDETTEILQNARSYAGLTGTSLYYIGCFMRALDTLNPENPGDAYCVPYAFNLRKQKAISPVLGNHVCALFAQASRNRVKHKHQLFDHLRQQNKDSIKRQLDFAFLPLMWAGSWLSMKQYGKTLRRSFENGSERASFWFSDIGPLDLSDFSLTGASIDNVFHLCQLPSPPALGLLSCIYRGRLSLSYNFIEPILDMETIERLHRHMSQQLLDTDVQSVNSREIKK